MPAFRDSCACELNSTATPPPDTIIGAIFQVVKGAQSPIYSTASLLFSPIVAVASWRSRSAGDMCRKSIFVSFRNERLRMTTHWPRHTHREDVLRRAWWLHIILAVIFMHEFPSCVEFWDGWDFFLGEPNIYAPKCCGVAGKRTRRSGLILLSSRPMIGRCRYVSHSRCSTSLCYGITTS